MRTTLTLREDLVVEAQRLATLHTTGQWSPPATQHRRFVAEMANTGATENRCV